jgi:hypothetical protein
MTVGTHVVLRKDTPRRALLAGITGSRTGKTQCLGSLSLSSPEENECMLPSQRWSCLYFQYLDMHVHTFIHTDLKINKSPSLDSVAVSRH